MCWHPLPDGAGADDDRIAARRARFREASASPFGPADEVGMLNLVTPESRARVLAAADASTLFDLSVEYFPGMPSWTATGDPSYQIWMSHTPSGSIAESTSDARRAQYELASYSGDCIAMYTHCGTHVDTLNHFGYRGRIWNGFRPDDHLGSRHWNVAGAEKHPPIVARGILVDVAALHGVTMLPDSYGIGAHDLGAALARQNVTLQPGDVVLIRTGRMTVWPDRDRYLMNEPGINREGAELLAKAGAIMIGGDNVGLEQQPTVDPENRHVVHTYLLAECGIPILEVVDLEALAAERLYEFAFVGACIRLRGATGSPMRPLAFPFRRI
ncbi:MAG: cyclase family protein [Chloroflexi bacterium]|nr:cyclase family protein [Chloroflexota bacterium]